jgi:ketosteroid isomerase-like protein
VFTFRGGKVASVREYRTTEEALEALGLSEQDAHAAT